MSGIQSFPYLLVNAFLSLGVCSSLSALGWIAAKDVEAVAVAVAFSVFVAPFILATLVGRPGASGTSAPTTRETRPFTALGWKFRLGAHLFLGFVFAVIATLPAWGLSATAGLAVSVRVLFAAVLPVVLTWCVFYALRFELAEVVSLRHMTPVVSRLAPRPLTAELIWASNLLASTRRHTARHA